MEKRQKRCHKSQPQSSSTFRMVKNRGMNGCSAALQQHWLLVTETCRVNVALPAPDKRRPPAGSCRAGEIKGLLTGSFQAGLRWR